MDTVVTPTLTYAAGTWTTTKEHKKMFRTTQRGMLNEKIQTEKNKEDSDGGRHPK